ncbi:MAG: polyprenyl synthetase family protein [Actinomycetota bacterium]|nr:polyprenyl synthetase family protein [Actinomycetota bacterium]
MSSQPMDLLSGDPELEASLTSAMAQVESALHEAIKSDYPFVTETSTHLVDAGGKRFRPLLTLLAAQFGDPRRKEVIEAAVVVELTHLATLYHDDVMDEAKMRRGADSANARWDNSIAILTGDFLFARASDILADLGPSAVRIQARTFERLCIGQIRETVGPIDGADPVQHHLQVLADKTGSLIATAGQFGAMLSGADELTVEVLTKFGECIGVAFQLADDLVDITSESEQSGKTPGTDLREGVPTLAVLIALSSTDTADSRLQQLLSRPLPDPIEHAEALALLRQHSALEEAQVEARRWADDARKSLVELPAGAPREALEQLCDYVVSRTG